MVVYRISEEGLHGRQAGSIASVQFQPKEEGIRKTSSQFHLTGSGRSDQRFRSRIGNQADFIALTEAGKLDVRIFSADGDVPEGGGEAFRRYGSEICLRPGGQIRNITAALAQSLQQIRPGSGRGIQTLAGHGEAAQKTGTMIITASGNRQLPAGAKLLMPPEGCFFIPLGHDTIPYLQTVEGQRKIPFPGNQRAEGMVDDTESPIFFCLHE